MKILQAFVCICFFTIMTILGCSQSRDSSSRDWDQITFMITDLSGESKRPIVFKGQHVTYHEDHIRLTEGAGGDAETYLLLPQHAVEDKRYIYVPFAESGAGSGVFWELQVIDKKTRMTTDYANLGDRVNIRSISIGKDKKIAVAYQKRSLPNKKALTDNYTNYYEMHKGKLQLVDVEPDIKLLH